MNKYKVILVVAAAGFGTGAIVGAVGMYQWMKAHQGGLGSDGSSISLEMNPETPSISETAETEASTEQTETTEHTIELVTEPRGTIVVTVQENIYVYHGESFTLDELIGFLKMQDHETVVEVKDAYASKSAYDSLIAALDDYEISYVE